MKRFLLVVVLNMVSLYAIALEDFTGKVTYLEPTYMPSTVRFAIDGGNSSCPVGKAITWSKSNLENNKVVYSTIMAAMMANKSVRIYINNGDSECKARFVHLLPN